MMKRWIQISLLWLAFFIPSAHAVQPAFKILLLTERGGQHGPFTDQAIKWLEQEAQTQNFEWIELHNTQLINAELLEQIQLIIQLDYPPYTFTPEAEAAFVDYIEQGKGGWIGFHHATLLGEFDGYPMWNWFSNFMGGIRFKNYIAEKASATVYVEDQEHPVMKGVNSSFLIPDDEWYTFDKNPRDQVHVIAHVDESTYQPDSAIKMGDHPVIWTNLQMKAKNVYFLFGHSASLFTSADFKRMFSNAISWASEKSN